MKCSENPVYNIFYGAKERAEKKELEIKQTEEANMKPISEREYLYNLYLYEENLVIKDLLEKELRRIDVQEAGEGLFIDTANKIYKINGRNLNKSNRISIIIDAQSGIVSVESQFKDFTNLHNTDIAVKIGKLHADNQS